MKNPCKNCTERKPGSLDGPSCHTNCERYQAWTAMIRAAKAEERKSNIAAEVIIDKVRAYKRQVHRHRER